MKTKKIFIVDFHGNIHEAEIFCEEIDAHCEIWKILHKSIPEGFPLEAEALTFIKDSTGWHLNILQEDRSGKIIREESIQISGETIRGEYLTFNREEAAGKAAEIERKGVLMI